MTTGDEAGVAPGKLTILGLNPDRPSRLLSAYAQHSGNISCRTSLRSGHLHLAAVGLAVAVVRAELHPAGRRRHPIPSAKYHTAPPTSQEHRRVANSAFGERVPDFTVGERPLRQPLQHGWAGGLKLLVDLFQR